LRFLQGQIATLKSVIINQTATEVKLGRLNDGLVKEKEDMQAEMAQLRQHNRELIA
jgi:cell division protein FtsB